MYQDTFYELSILIGCVDNNKSRQLCHRVFQKVTPLVYIDNVVDIIHHCGGGGQIGDNALGRGYSHLLTGQLGRVLVLVLQNIAA